MFYNTQNFLESIQLFDQPLKNFRIPPYLQHIDFGDRFNQYFEMMDIIKK